MSKTIRIDEPTANVVNELGGTFDSPNEVIQRLIRESGRGEELDRAIEAESSDSSIENDTYSVTIIENGSEGKTFSESGHGAQTRVMNQIANHLILNHDLISKISPLPYVPRGQKALINNTNKHPNGSTMNGPQPLADGYYMDTNYDSNAKSIRIADLANECGLSVEFSSNWHE